MLLHTVSKSQDLSSWTWNGRQWQHVSSLLLVSYTGCPQSWSHGCSHWTPPHCGDPSTAQSRPTTWPRAAKALKASRMGVREEASVMLDSLRWLHSDPRAGRAWSPVVCKSPRELTPGTARGCGLRPPSPFHLERLLLYLFYLWKVQSETTFLGFAG